MKFVRRTSSLLLLALTTAACATEDGSAPTDGLDSPRETVDPMAVVCDPSNQVAYFSGADLPTGLCGDVGPWLGQPLFDGPGDVPQGLERYCLYTYAPGGADVDEAGNLGSHLGANFELAADCRAVTPQGSAISDEIGAGLDAYFGWLAGRITPDEISTPLAQQPVHTAVVDTYPHAEPSKPRSSHGPIVSSIINSFVCPAGTGCAVQVHNYLGLPRTGTTVDYNRGGLVGRQSDLAKGIMEALAAHEMFHAGDPLVINLSVAWEAEEFGGMDSNDLSPPVRAVYDALRVARCEGALIIAAAGNASDISCSGEPMAPARWEEIAAPDGGECAELGVSNAYVDPAAHAPLVHAIGGIYGPQTKMMASRQAGMPRLAAASSHAVAQPGPGLPALEVRNGTSIGTAVASATASLIWSYDTSLSPSTVMRKIYEAGEPIGSLTADFGPGGAVTAVHRVDTCKALEEAIPAFSLGCDDREQPVTLAQLVNFTEAAVTNSDVVSIGTGLDCTDACDNPYKLYPQAGSTRTCTSIESDPWSKLTSPQPIITGCQECILTNDTSAQESTALITVVSDFAGYEIKGVDIEVFDENDFSDKYNVAEKDLASGTLIPAYGEILDYDVPLDLEKFVPIRAMIYMYFIDPKTGEAFETIDSMMVRSY